MSTQRDVFIESLYKKALDDKNIIFISADMGAPALDQWRINLPEQFIAIGIAEQNAINVAAGLAASGKKVFVYSMASWFARCLEQIKYSCAMPNIKITFLGNGVALGYAPSGPAHEPTEDIALSRAIVNLEVISPSNLDSAEKLVDLCINDSKLRYIRFERNFAKQVSDYKYDVQNSYQILEESNCNSNKNVAILSSGYLLGRALDIYYSLKDRFNIKVIDVYKLKDLEKTNLLKILETSSHIITLEEQTLNGGFGSVFCEIVCDHCFTTKVKRFGLNERFIFENGTREQLLNKNGLEINSLISQSEMFVKND